MERSKKTVCPNLRLLLTGEAWARAGDSPAAIADNDRGIDGDDSAQRVVGGPPGLLHHRPHRHVGPLPPAAYIANPVDLAVDVVLGWVVLQWVMRRLAPVIRRLSPQGARFRWKTAEPDYCERSIEDGRRLVVNLCRPNISHARACGQTAVPERREVITEITP